MKDEELRRLIRLVEESQIDELEIRRWWSRIRITKAGVLSRRRNPGEAVAWTASENDARAPAGDPRTGAAVPEAPAGEDKGLVTIVSPIVGTFYRAPAPGAEPYVEVGSHVLPGQVVCIVEAMKLMNEIESEVAGAIEKILVENEQPVEFNQPLFLVRTDGTVSEARREAS